MFDQIASGIAAAGPQIEGNHRRDIGGPAPVHEFIGAEAVGSVLNQPNRGAPASSLVVQHRPPNCNRAARISNDGRAELLHQRQHGPPKTSFVYAPMAGLVDATVDASAPMFDERRKHQTDESSCDQW